MPRGDLVAAAWATFGRHQIVPRVEAVCWAETASEWGLGRLIGIDLLPALLAKVLDVSHV